MLFATKYILSSFLSRFYLLHMHSKIHFSIKAHISSTIQCIYCKFQHNDSAVSYKVFAILLNLVENSACY